MARDMVSYGLADCVMVVGFEKMAPGSLKSVYKDRASPLDTTMELMGDTVGFTSASLGAQIFGNAGREYMEK